jgi:hypothetical protein
MPYCKQELLFQPLKIKDSSEHGSAVNSGDKDTSFISGDSVPKSVQL